MDLESDGRMLWVDAQRINREDKLEQGDQVSPMLVVYKTAKQVLVDLGDASDDSEQALELIDDFWKKHIWSGCMLEDGSVLAPEQVAIYVGLTLPDDRDALQTKELPLDD